MGVPKRLALVVGVNGQTVPGRNALKYAVHDAQEMAKTLQEDYCGFELFRPDLLLEEQATTAQVRYSVLDLIDKLQDGDFGLFFFSGHAEAVPIDAGMDDVYLVTHDFNVAHVKHDKNAHLSLRWLRQVLYEHKKAGSILIILDCCYAGKFGDTASDLYLEELQQRLNYYFDSPSAQSPSRPGGVRLALTATGSSTAKEENGHGLLTGYILTALRGKCEQAVNEQGQVTFHSLSDYLDTIMSPDQQPHSFGASSRLILATHTHLSAQAQREREQATQRAEREQLLRFMFADHSGFLHDRLESFVGRENELTEVLQRIDALLPTGGYLTITGQAGQGKSSMIAKLVDYAAREQHSFDRVAFHFIPLTPPPDYQVALLRNLMSRLILKYELSELFLASESRAALSEGFPRVLKEVAVKSGKEIIFIDGLDQLQADQQTGQRDLSFLPQGPGNPPQGIVFVLGTRPNDTLRPLELLKPYPEYALPHLSRDDFDYILQHRGVILEHTLADRFHESLDKNALYLDLVAKELAVRHDITNQEVEKIVQQIADDPENLFSLTIDRLRRQETLWIGVIKPVLGLLLVSNEPLIREHLKSLLNLDSTKKIDGEQLNRGLERLGGLIVIDDKHRYSLFHLKFREYLHQDSQRPNKKYIFDGEDEQHLIRRFIAWCEQGGIAHIWDDTRSDFIEQGRRCYARLHYITHLYRADDWNKLFGALDESSYGKAKVQYDTSTRTYALDLNLGRLATVSANWNRNKKFQYLPRLWQYTLLYCTLTTRADSYPAIIFRLMPLLKQEAKALGLAELLTDPARKAQVFLFITSYMLMQPGRELEAAQLLFRTEQMIISISNMKSKVEKLTELGRELAQAQRWQQAERVFLSLPVEWRKVEALTELGRTLIQAQQWQEAERVISSLSDNKYKVRELICLGIALAQEQNQQEAKRIWKQAKRVIHTLSDEGSKVEALTELGRVLAQAQLWQEAEQIWQETERMIYTLPDKQSKEISFTHLGAALAQAQLWHEAERVIHLITNDEYKVQALAELGTVLTQAQLWHEAERIWQQVEWVFDSISDEESKDRALTTLGGALAKAQLWHEAERVISSIFDEESKDRAMTDLAIQLTHAQFWQEAEQVIYSLSYKQSEIKAMEELRRTLAQVQEWQEAERVIHSIPDKWRKVEALTELGLALFQAQHWQNAKRIWQETERVIYTLSDEESKVMALTKLGLALVQAQYWQEANRIWQDIEKMILTPYREENKDDALYELGTALTQAQQWREAERVIRSISNEENKVQALTELGRALTQAQQWQEAERVILSLPNGENKTEVLTELWNALAKKHYWREAERVIHTLFNEQQRAEILSYTPNKSGEDDYAESLIQREWLRVTSRDEALTLFPLVCGLIPNNPDIGVELFNAFAWVDSFLRG